MSTPSAETAGVPVFVRFFECLACDGHGAVVDRSGEKPIAKLCERCCGNGELGATEDDLASASEIGSNNPFCPHDWSYTGSTYGGDEDSYHGEGRCYCSICGADGDA